MVVLFWRGEAKHTVLTVVTQAPLSGGGGWLQGGGGGREGEGGGCREGEEGGRGRGWLQGGGGGREGEGGGCREGEEGGGGGWHSGCTKPAGAVSGLVCGMNTLCFIL